MKHILLLAHFVSPSRGSEFSVAWNYIINQSREHKITVLYGASGDIFHDTTEMKKYLHANNMTNVRFIDVKCKDTGFTRLLFKVYLRNNIFFDITWNLIYRNWQLAAAEKAHELIADNSTPIDLIHYLSPIGFKEPGYTWQLDKPYIWGPVKAVDKRPFALYKVLSTSEIIKTIFRNETLALLLKYSSRIRKAIKRADVVVAAVPSAKEQFKRYFDVDCEYLPENGINQMETDQPILKTEGEKLRLIWIGRLDFNKALSLLLDSLRLIQDKNWELHVVGNGDLEEKLKAQAKLYSIHENIRWHGQITREQTQQFLRRSHLHIISSLGEGNPTTIWEAMSKGIPTLTLDHCGMSGTICEQCGIKIPITTYRQTIQDIADHINSLIDNPDRIHLLSKGVLECAKKFTWDSRTRFFNRQYEIAIDRFYQKKNGPEGC